MCVAVVVVVLIQLQKLECRGVLAIGYIAAAVWVNWWTASRAVAAAAVRLVVEDKEPEDIICAMIRSKGKAQRADLFEVAGMSRTSLGRLLDKMEKDGRIRQVGERKAAYYVVSE